MPVDRPNAVDCIPIQMFIEPKSGDRVFYYWGGRSKFTACILYIRYTYLKTVFKLV